MSVVFPAPFGPTSATIPVSGTSRSRQSTATNPPKRTVTLRASSIDAHRGTGRPFERQALRGTLPQHCFQAAREEQDDDDNHAAQGRERQAADRRGGVLDRV